MNLTKRHFVLLVVPLLLYSILFLYVSYTTLLFSQNIYKAIDKYLEIQKLEKSKVSTNILSSESGDLNFVYLTEHDNLNEKVLIFKKNKMTDVTNDFNKIKNDILKQINLSQNIKKVFFTNHLITDSLLLRGHDNNITIKLKDILKNFNNLHITTASIDMLYENKTEKTLINNLNYISINGDIWLNEIKDYDLIRKIQEHNKLDGNNIDSLVFTNVNKKMIYIYSDNESNNKYITYENGIISKPMDLNDKILSLLTKHSLNVKEKTHP